MRWLFAAALAGVFLWYRRQHPPVVMPDELKALLVTRQEFDGKVLRAPRPALVLFTDPLGYDLAYARVAKECGAIMDSFVVDLVREPGLGDAHRVKEQSDLARGQHMLVIFSQGQEVKRADLFDLENEVVNTNTEIRDHIANHDPPEKYRDSLMAAFTAKIEDFAGCH